MTDLTSIRKRSIWLALIVPVAFFASQSFSGEAPREIVFGGDSAYPPFEWTSDSGPAGFNIELENAVAKAGGATAVHRLGSWPETVKALRSGEVDVVPMFRSAEREKEFLFTSAIYYVHHAIYSLPGKPAAFSPDQLTGQLVAVEEMSYAHQKIIEEELEIRLSLQPNTLEALEAVANGNADYALLSKPVTDELIRRYKLPLFAQSGSLIWPREYGFAVRADRADLAAWLRESLAVTISTGKYDEIYKKWEERLEGQHETLLTELQDVLIVLVPILLLMILGTLWVWTLRRTVRARTAELVTELRHRESAEEALRFASDHNIDSGLPLTFYFMNLVDERLNTNKNKGNEAELCILSLTDLGRVARTFGYDVAGKARQKFAARVRESGYAVAGDFGRGVFGIFTDKNSTHGWFDLLSEPVMVGELEFYPNLVGGSSYWPADGSSAMDLVKRAETAMEFSLAQGRTWARYEPSMEPDKTDLQIVADIRRSRGSDLTLALQPQVDLMTNTVCGAEALVRWNHTKYGFISPARFIPLLENAGLIHLVTERMVAEAVRVAKQLCNIGQEIPVSVNVSAQDFVGDALIENVKAELDRQDCPGHWLKVELTETSVADDPESVRRALTILSEMGVSASIDDFGTGYSSMSYLSSYPVSEIKIDREFVDGMTTIPNKQSIVRSTVALAKELGMKSVAEGAEDEATLDALKNIGCDKVQGYVISRPLSEEDFYSYVVQRKV